MQQIEKAIKSGENEVANPVSKIYRYCECVPPTETLKCIWQLNYFRNYNSEFLRKLNMRTCTRRIFC